MYTPKYNVMQWYARKRRLIKFSIQFHEIHFGSTQTIF